MRKVFLSFLLIAGLYACQTANESYSEGELLAESAEYDDATQISSKLANSNGGGANQLAVQTDRKIIWSANVEFQVKNVDESTKRIGEITNKFNGFVSGMDLSSSHTRISNRIVIRIESSRFDSLLNELKGESIFMKNIKINSQDVTEEFVDIQSRLKTKKEVRERYIAILRDKTGEVKDVIAAEEAIRKITEEIEAKEGRLRYLKDKVKFSTITLNIYQEVEFTKEPTVYVKPYSEKVVEGFGNGWSIITNLVLGLVNIWPLILFGSVFIWKRKWIGSKFKKKRG